MDKTVSDELNKAIKATGGGFKTKYEPMRPMTPYKIKEEEKHVWLPNSEANTNSSATSTSVT